MALSAKPLPPLAELQQRYSYCPETGELRFREHRCVNKIGALVGTPQVDRNTSYLRVNHKGRLILVHRICFYLGTGKEPTNVIDHINGNGLDNRLSNLRDVANTLNARNRNTPVLSSAGVRGVTWCSPKECYRARISVGSGLKHLGYGDLLHCAALRKSAEQRLGYL
jgi:ribosomal protein L32